MVEIASSSAPQVESEYARPLLPSRRKWGRDMKSFVLSAAPPWVALLCRAIRAAVREPGLRHIGKGRVFVDVGAHAGIWSFWAARKYGSVVAFEPNTALCGRLHAALPDVLTVPVALSDRTGRAEMYTPQIDGRTRTSRGTLHLAALMGGEHSSNWVRCATLDEFNLDEVDFIKVDVEGLETPFLDGAEATIRRCRPRLYIEIEDIHTPGSAVAVAERICGWGYRMFGQTRRGLVSTIPGELPHLQACGPGDPAYIHDFLFIPA